MKNLKLQNRTVIKDEVLLNSCQCITVDTDSNTVFCVNDANELISLNINENTVTKCCSLNTNFDTGSFNAAISCEYLFEDHCVITSLTNGRILSYDTISKNVNFVGSLSDGIEGMSFSSDQDTVVFVTKTQKLLLMTKGFDVIAEHDLDQENLDVNDTINIGWGSVATQFHGSGGKYVPKDEMIKASDSDDGKSRVNWRGDGMYFVTSTIDKNYQHRRLRIWNRDAELQYISESVSGLDDLICWKPSGQLIVASQQLPNKIQIIFFEKNGLRHGEFTLPYAPNTFVINHISWSFDSRILLVIGFEMEDKNPKKQILMLWTCSNYHWYEKQVLVFSDKKIVQSLWDQSDASKLHILFNNGEYCQYIWKWTIHSYKDTVAVIDGKQLKVSQFEKSIIPPPLFRYSFDFNNEVLDVCFAESSDFLVILNNDSFVYFDSILNDQDDLRESLNQLKPFKDISNLNNLILSHSGKLFGIFTSLQYKNDILVSIDVRSDIPEMNQLVNLNEKVTALACKGSIVAIVMSNNQLWKYDIDTGTFSQWRDVNNLPIIYTQMCYHIQLFEIDNQLCIIALSSLQTLYLNNQIICENICNSFNIFNNCFLLFTTNDNYLHCHYLDRKLMEVNNNVFSDSESLRNVERGSEIITSSIKDAKVILQMPRGNLETIYPRPLLINAATIHLDNLQFDVVFELLRKHRINLNFICDYHYENFMNHLGLFVKQIANRNVQWLCLFLHELDSYETSSKLYAKFVNHKPNFSNDLIIPDKVDSICDSLRKTMENINATELLHPILLTYIKKTNPEVCSALKTIKMLENSQLRDDAIKFLTYILDVNKLFDEALGTYDFDILLMVAQKSQKDPKEYLSLIEEMKSIESESYRCYKIDIYLKRYKNALIHIAKCSYSNDDHFEECIDLVKKHHLYNKATELFENDSTDKRTRIWKLYGEYLLSKRYYEESAIAFKRCGDYENSVKAYQLSGNWNGAIAAALKCSSINMSDILNNLAQQLESRGKYVEASYLYENYMNDMRNAILVLINGHEWEYVIRMLIKCKDNDIENIFHTELIHHYDVMIELIRDRNMKLTKFTQRLTFIRKEKLRMKFENESNEIRDNVSDVYSDTSSVKSFPDSASGSLGSLNTRISKNVKKHEKKKYMLKEGSKDEDIQLIFAIKEIVTAIDTTQEEVSLLIKTLYDTNYIERSSVIQIEYQILINLIKDAIKDIWKDTNDTNFIIKDEEIRNAPTLRDINWKLSLIIH